MKKVYIYDLDGTLIDSNHRYATLPNGSIDLSFWIKHATPDNIAKDSLLPLSKHYKAALNNPSVYVVVATARQMQDADFDYLHDKLGKPDHIIYRKANDARHDAALKVAGLRRLFGLRQFKACTKVFFDDNIHNLKAVAALGVKAIPC